MDNQTAKQFIKEWLSDNTNAEICKTLGISSATIGKRAKLLREMGVNLPDRNAMRKNRINVGLLNRYIDKIKG